MAAYDFSQTLGAFENIAARGLAATPMDLTISGEVAKIENPGIGQYLIKYQSNTWFAFSVNPEIVYSVGEKVYVLVPQGDFSGKKIIIGRSSAADNVSYAEMQEMTNFFVPHGPNWLSKEFYGQDHEQLGICAVPRADRGSVINLEGANYTDYGFARWPYASNEENQALWPDNKMTLPPKNHHYAEDRDPTSYPTEKQLEFADRMIQGMNTTLTWVGVKAKFRTEFLAEHSQGKYGVRVEYLIKNHRYEAPHRDANGVMHPGRTDVPKYDIVAKEVSFESFNGNPYAYYADTEQVGYFQIPLNQIVGLYRVSLFQNSTDNGKSDEENRLIDFEVDCMPTYNDEGQLMYLPKDNVYDRNNIFASEIDIRFYEKKNLLDSKYLVWITADKGRYLYDGDGTAQGVSEVTLTAHLFYGNKDILNENDYNVYWFRECPDYDATNSSQNGRDDNGNKWKQYGGFGWAPIVRPTEGFGADDEDGTYVEDWMPVTVDDYGTYAPPPEGHPIARHTLTWNTLTIPKDQVPWRWLYQCVIVQKRNREIKDDTGNVLESGVLDQNPYWRYVEPSGLDGFEVCRLGGKYDLWMSDVIVDGTRSMLEIREKEAWDTSYSPPRMNPDWFGNWWVETPGRAPYAFAQQPDANNPDNPRQIQYDANIYEGQVDISPYVDSEWQKFIVGCYDPKMLKVTGVDGVAANFGKNHTMCVGVLRKRLENGNGSGLHISWDPNQLIFNYDANGMGKAFTSENDWTLRPYIHWDDGLFDKGIVKIYGPGGIDTEPLDKIVVYEGDEIGQGYTPADVMTMLHDIYIETTGQNETPIIHFKINDRWSDANTGTEADNHFYLTLEAYTGEIYGPYDYEIIFNKDGGSGSNGTGWSVDISPCNPEPAGKDGKLKKFSQKYNYAMPVVVTEDNTHATGWKMMSKDGAKLATHPVYIRPFIQKGGEGQGARPEGTDIARENSLFTEFYQFAKQLGYWAEYFWDVRIKGADGGSGYQYKSFVKLCDPETHNPFVYQDFKPYYGMGPRGWANENDKDWPAVPGMCGYSHSEDRNFGAVEIQWNEKMDQPLKQAFADFVVSLEVVIYKDCYNQSAGKIEPHSATRKLVTTIYAYYPLDVFFDKGFTSDIGGKVEGFNPKYVSLNWPRILEYSTVGNAPQYESSQYGLEFYYGPNAKNLSRHDYQWNACQNLTPAIQDVFETDGPEVEYLSHAENGQYQLKTKRYGTIVERDVPTTSGEISKKKYWTIQTYQPKGQLNPVDGMIGGLATFQDGTSVFGHNGRYYRAQIFTINRFGNQAVNAWDGQSIELDHENGAILAPTVVAGYKSPTGNDFSGCIMGVDKQITKNWALKKGFADDKEQWDNRQVNFTDHSAVYEQENLYMAGLYGYQKGVCSFGLMENGVAFFGRANGGAQIIIDGSNGVIRGGGNGYTRSPSIADPMWNSMRLNLVDLTHNRSHTFVQSKDELGATEYSNDHPATGVTIPAGHGEETGENKSEEIRLDYATYFRNPVYDTGQYDSTDRDRLNMPNWYKETWQRATIKRNGNYPYYLGGEEGEAFKQTTYEKWNSLPEYDPLIHTDAYANDLEFKVDYWSGRAIMDYVTTTEVENSRIAQPRSTFSAGRASTTPAIEIGQHPDGLIPGALRWGTAKTMWAEFYIPGNRNFMVTYDGTLWAMNGVFMGNVIGSNFIGGRIQGSEIGIGFETSSKNFWWQDVTSDDEWEKMFGPTYVQGDEGVVNKGEFGDDELIPRFYVDKFGNLTAASARIFGGSLDIGSFHVLGPYQVGVDGTVINDEDYGKIVQFGESDFVGLTHFYGNVGIAPTLRKSEEDPAGSNFGHLTQTYGQVALGIVAGKDNPSEIHEAVALAMGMTGDGIIGERMDYKAELGAKIADGATLEQAAIFGIDTAVEFPDGGVNDFNSGHFWPMSHYYTDKASIAKDLIAGGMKPGWFTTMNIFAAGDGFTPKAAPEQGAARPSIKGGSNYFRVSPFATESRFMYIKETWQDEDECAFPTYDDYVGYMGLTERAGGNENATSWGIGFQSFCGHPVMIHSAAEACIRARGFVQFCSNYSELGEPRKIAAFSHEEELYYPTSGAGGPYSMIQMGYFQGDEPKPKTYDKGLIVQQAWNKGGIAIGAFDEKPGGGTGTGTWNMNNPINAALILNGGNGDYMEKGTWLWNKKDDVHIVMAEKDNDPQGTELLLNKTFIRGNAARGIWFTLQEEPHREMDGGGADDVGAFGMDVGSAGMYHPKRVAVTSGVDKGTWSKVLTEAGGGMGIVFEGKEFTKWGYDNGHAHIEKNKFIFKGDLAIPDNQYCIYARFG